MHRPRYQQTPKQSWDCFVHGCQVKINKMHKTGWITTALRVTVKIRGQSVNKRFLVLMITQLPRLKPTLVLIAFSTVLHPWRYTRWMKGLDKLQGCVTPIDSIITAATTGQNSDQFFSAVWPLTDWFLGFDRWLHWISTVDRWLYTHLRKYTEKCIVTPPRP